MNFRVSYYLVHSHFSLMTACTPQAQNIMVHLEQIHPLNVSFNIILLLGRKKI